MSKSFYLTTPLYYVNDIPHVGHAYTTVIADALARYKRMCGFDVCLLTGTDEHGLKIERAAQDRGITPAQMTDEFAAAFRKTWGALGIEFDEFIRTTEPRHSVAVQTAFLKMKEKGFIYEGKYSGQYCIRCEAYVTGNSEICPDCGAKTEHIEEASYFFKLSAFQDRLLAFYRDTPDFVVPQSRMNEIVSFVMSGLKDFSISRTSFSWGIPIPGDEKHIAYVWFDALHGYLSGIGLGEDENRVEQRWPADVQLMGKDILRFHGVYWPALLMAAGLEPPRQLLVHGWWTINGEKMSKSLGNFVTVEALLRAMPADYLKYFLLREITLGSDGNFSIDALLTRVNSDLANDLGNLASRILKMIQTYFDGVIPGSAGLEPPDQHMVVFSKETIRLYRANFDKFQIAKALETVWELISLANKYIVASEPWQLAKDATQKDRLGTVLYNSAEVLRIIASLLAPILPDGTTSIARQLGIQSAIGKTRLDELSWGGLKPGTRIGSLETVYPRLTRQQVEDGLEGKPPVVAEKTASEPGAAELPKQDDKISIEDFARVEMQVGRVVEAERVPKSDKLIRLRVDIGSEVRQVVAGIGKAYEPDGLVGRLVVVVTNLKPAKLMGVESNGMIVAASVGGHPVLATFTEPVEVGTRLR